MAEAKARIARPLSPHLQIYKPMLTMMMSIFHRLTGAGLYFGSLLLAAWLIAAASGPDAWEAAGAFFGSIFGRLVLFGYSWALVHHMLGGIRHLIWDTGRALDLRSIEVLARATIAGSLTLTVLLWMAVLMAGGAP